jgi:hypothetical protein
MEKLLREDWPSKNAQLRDAVNKAAGNDPALKAAIYAVARKLPTNALLEDVHANLQARAYEVLRLRPDLVENFIGLLPGL